MEPTIDKPDMEPTIEKPDRESVLTPNDFQSSVEEVITWSSDAKSPSDLAERWTKVYQGLNDTKHKKILIDRLLNPDFELFDLEDGTGMRTFLPEQVKALLVLLPFAEKLLAAGLLSEAMELTIYLGKIDSERMKDHNERKNKRKTLKATEAHQNDGFWLPIVLELEQYLKEVDENWHPPEQSQGEQRIRSHIQKGRAVEFVWNRYSTEIIELLKKNQVKMEFKKTFSKCFSIYLKFKIVLNRNSQNNEIPVYFFKERRKKRSRASRERSRIGAIKMWERRRNKGIKEQQ